MQRAEKLCNHRAGTRYHIRGLAMFDVSRDHGLYLSTIRNEAGAVVRTLQGNTMAEAVRNAEWWISHNRTAAQG